MSTICHVFIACHNESILISHTVNHYKKYLPNCKITIYDNYSDDNSRDIAVSLGCNVILFDSGNISSEYCLLKVKNNCWKQVNDTKWVIVADMDEWLCVTESQLDEEEKMGTTILTTQGKQMIGTSNRLDLTDINLHEINRGMDNSNESKKLCFRPNCVTDINYDPGAHSCNPTGVIEYSKHVYTNKHMAELGIPFLINKSKTRFERSHEDRTKRGFSCHYTDDANDVIQSYNRDFANSMIIDI